jgi:hypothetical protein
MINDEYQMLNVQGCIMMCLINHYELQILKIILFSLDDLIYDDPIVALQLSLLTSNIRREVCEVFDGFLSFFKKYEKNKINNILSIMLDPRFKNLKLVSSFIGQEHDVSIVEEYDQ